MSATTERWLPCRCDPCDTCFGSGSAKGEGGSCGCDPICRCPEFCPDCEGAGRMRSRAPACDIEEHRAPAAEIASLRAQIKILRTENEKLQAAIDKRPSAPVLRLVAFAGGAR